jgi:hypothetical protein
MRRASCRRHVMREFGTLRPGTAIESEPCDGVKIGKAVLSNALFGSTPAVAADRSRFAGRRIGVPSGIADRPRLAAVLSVAQPDSSAAELLIPALARVSSGILSTPLVEEREPPPDSSAVETLTSPSPSTMNIPATTRATLIAPPDRSGSRLDDVASRTSRVVCDRTVHERPNRIGESECCRFRSRIRLA